MNICCFDVVMVMLWSIYVFLWWMNEWMHVDGCSVGVEVEDVEDFELLYEWFGVCLWGFVANESDDFLVCLVEWLHVCFV